MSLRPAQLADIPALQALIAESVMVLQLDYSEAQRQAALGTVFGVDTQLIIDQTYFVVELDGEIVACGGWSFRKTLYGADALAGREDNRLDPATDAARIRAFFVKPGWTRRGLGGQILKACEAAAVAAGFRRFELGATLTGIPLYRAYGYEPIEATEAQMADGLTLPIVRMGKTL
ncbi:GNAT family N-acetyltransferase [Asticcacaulis sp.]|uniref:GNAT family N-acetyltransferase n=1 Tax=Asticcacaulis sp. TaxID=1872648 RepID=UPI002BFD7612|nr:GNAT family N-acetyltransferase [Asticcacaulis sp.]HTM82952.1 GNAT family N-acetyltransferase [Asticcacaulis sp.]